jgi:hypothetical protein
MFRLAGNRTNTGVPPTRRDRRRARASSPASAAASRCAPTTNSDQRPSHECSGRAPSHHPDVPLGRRGYHRRVGRAAQRRRADHRHQSAV